MSRYFFGASQSSQTLTAGQQHVEKTVPGNDTKAANDDRFPYLFTFIAEALYARALPCVGQEFKILCFLNSIDVARPAAVVVVSLRVVNLAFRSRAFFPEPGSSL